MATISFSISTAAFDVNLLPPEARQVGSPAFREAVNEFFQNEFRDFGGHATIRVDDQTISVLWDPDSTRPNPMTAIVEKLQQGRRAEGIQLLEMLLSHRPDDPEVLYNLGMALSDAGRLERAEQHLRRASELAPNNVNIAVALAVALARLGRDEEALDLLEAAVAQSPANPWARRNLAGMLMRLGKPSEAIPHWEAVIQALPKDQLSWIGLADAYRLTGRKQEAQAAYRTAIEIEPHNDLAEKARAGSNALAQSGFERVREVIPRQDAVAFCLDALRRFSKMPPDEVKKVALELAMAGRDGFSVHDPNKRYRVKGLESEFSGLAAVCFLYVAIQQVAPGTDIGFDLAREYEQAKELFSSRD
jgi:tetratricopeptide (TPR) repeat protein